MRTSYKLNVLMNIISIIYIYIYIYIYELLNINQTLLGKTNSENPYPKHPFELKSNVPLAHHSTLPPTHFNG
jgi:hypothetical protein